MQELVNVLLEYTATHCDSYGIKSALEDYGLEILVSRVSMEHVTPARNEKSQRMFICDKRYKKLKQTIVINNIICKIGKILHEVDKIILEYNK